MRNALLFLYVQVEKLQAVNQEKIPPVKHSGVVVISSSSFLKLFLLSYGHYLFVKPWSQTAWVQTLTATIC